MGAKTKKGKVGAGNSKTSLGGKGVIGVVIVVLAVIVSIVWDQSGGEHEQSVRDCMVGLIRPRLNSEM